MSRPSDRRFKDHGDHETVCVTYDCQRSEHDPSVCAVRCVTCHCWVETRPTSVDAPLGASDAQLDLLALLATDEG